MIALCTVGETSAVAALQQCAVAVPEATLGVGPVASAEVDAAPSPITPFHFTQAMHAFCVDITQTVPEFRHIDMQRVAISFSRTRKRVMHGLYATTTPLRFAGGRLIEMRHGREYRVQRLFREGGVEVLYIIRFYLPRFLDLEYREKLITVFHELWHISPEFDGDLRRHPGRCYAHSQSQQAYDELMARFVDNYLACGPPQAEFAFLDYSFDKLRQLHENIRGEMIRHPRVIPIS